MVYVTGDTHGLKEELKKLNTKNFTASNNLTKGDYVIICGDFGLIWNNSKEEKRWLSKLAEKNFTTLWLDGNHENFDLLEEYPVQEWNGGKVQFINDSVIHLMRGQVYIINDLKFFIFGGAESTDKIFRREHVSWWEQELPSKEEYEEGMKNLEKHNFNVDYILTHDCSQHLKNLLLEKEAKSTELNQYFDYLEHKLNFKHWYFGHYHEDATFQDKKHTVLYHDVIRLI